MAGGPKGGPVDHGDQRRYVAILYSDICGSTRLGEATDPENLAEIVRSVKLLATEIIERFGGIVTQFHGDGVLSVFGYPEPGEDDIRHATEAALTLHEQVGALDLRDYLPEGFSLRLHSGIDCGLIVIRDGDFLDGALELVGDAVNTAAGLCSAASDDEILASATALRSLSPYFVTADLGAIALKGKSRAVPAIKVLRRSRVQNRFEASRARGLSTFCGRDRELARLHEGLAASIDGRLEIMRVVGDPGMGKTRLIEEFLDDAVRRDCWVHRGQCERRGAVAPLHPFLQMLRAYFDLDALTPASNAAASVERRLEGLGGGMLAHAEALLSAVTTAPAADSAIARERAGLEEPLAELFLAQAATRPVVVVIDDWQWIDDASRNVLRYLSQVAAAARILIVLAARDHRTDDALANRAVTIELGPIGERDTAQIVHMLMPDRPDPGIVATLHRKSGGNPLFLEELCQSFADWSRNEANTGSGGVVPATLQGLIESRMRRLPDDLIELVQAAAVIGNVIPVWLLDRLCGLDGGEDVVARLAASDMIYGGEIKGTLRFKHGITRETVYATVRLAKRRALHNRVAAILESLGERGSLEDQYENLAYHFAGGASYRKALDYAERAGDKALASSALDRAREQFEAAMAAIDRLPDSADLRQRWVAISGRWALPCVYGPEQGDLEVLARTVDYAKGLGDWDGLAHAYYWQGYISHVMGDQTASIGYYRQAMEAAETAGNHRLAVQVVATLGQSHAAASSYDDALVFLDQAIAEKLRHPTRYRVRVGSSYALSSKSLVLGDLGDFPGAHACSREAYETVHGQGHEIESSILNNRSVVCLWQGRWREAVDYSQQSSLIAERVSAPYLSACAAALNAYARWMLSRDEDAIPVLRSTISWVEDKGMLLYSSFFYAWISDALATVGEAAEAARFAQKALERAGRRDRLGEAMAFRSLALAAASGGGGLALEAPEVYLDLALRAARERKAPHDVAVTQMHMARRAALTGDAQGAATLRAQAEAAFTAMDMHWHLEALAREVG